MVILQNSGSPGTFAAPVTYLAQPGTIALAVGDLDGDGLPDIAMASLYPQGQGYIAIMTQVASAPGTFALTESEAGAGQPVSIAIGDVDHDGRPDLVTADGTSAVWYKNVAATATTAAGFALQAQIGTFQ
jgi:hypothetical protein